MNRTPTQQPSKQGSQPDSFKKGGIFEDYIIRLFNEKSFHLKKSEVEGSIKGKEKE